MSKPRPMSTKERKTRHDAGQRAMGRKRVEFWLTDEEKAQLKKLLREQIFAEDK